MYSDAHLQKCPRKFQVGPGLIRDIDDHLVDHLIHHTADQRILIRTDSHALYILSHHGPVDDCKAKEPVIADDGCCNNPDHIPGRRFCRNHQDLAGILDFVIAALQIKLLKAAQRPGGRDAEHEVHGQRPPGQIRHEPQEIGAEAEDAKDKAFEPEDRRQFLQTPSLQDPVTGAEHDGQGQVQQRSKKIELPERGGLSPEQKRVNALGKHKREFHRTDIDHDKVKMSQPSLFHLKIPPSVPLQFLKRLWHSAPR